MAELLVRRRSCSAEECIEPFGQRSSVRWVVVHFIQGFLRVSNVPRCIQQRPVKRRDHLAPVSIFSITAFHDFATMDNVTRSLNGLHNNKKKVEIHRWPLRTIEFTASKSLELATHQPEAFPPFGGVPEVSLYSGGGRRAGADWVVFPDRIKVDHALTHVRNVRRSKNGVRFCLQEEPPLDGRTEDCSKNRQDSANCRPGIPPHYAVAYAKLHAWADSIPQLLPTRHSLIPLWIRRHSAMPSRHAEHCHG